MIPPPAKHSELLDTAIKSLQDILTARNVPTEPLNELVSVAGFADLYKTLLEVRHAIMAIASGDLMYPIHMKGYVPGAIKGMQASLRHLSWQTKAIASGDYSQRVDFMGEFSEAFNTMVMQLDETMHKLRLREQDLEKMARTDPLTGANNRGYFMELLQAEIERSQRYHHTFSIMMMDVDHFKSVNDTHGHAAGDEALRTMIRVFQSSGLRKSDFWGRIGGEEFAVALPETGIRAACEVAERLRSNLSRATISYADTHFFITASIGISQFKPGDTREAVLHRADQAMYTAKQTGRNRVCLFPD
ncbi:MAG: GGDEF domain-containing protein [Desulfatirhabdiaceae bacterium]